MYFKIKYNLIRAVLFFLLFKRKGYGVELGVWKGLSAKMIYYLTKPDEFILVDPYKVELCNEVYTKILPQHIFDKMYEKVYRWVFNRTNVLLYRNTSKQIAEYIFTGGLDWIYIDADHFDVYNDLTNWYPHIKKGGIIMGDDYGCKGYPKVKKDVDRFCKERGIKLNKFHFQFWFKKGI